MGKATVVFSEPITSSALDGVQISGRKLQCKRIKGVAQEVYESAIPTNDVEESQSLAEANISVVLNFAQEEVTDYASPQAEWFMLTDDRGDAHSALIKYSQEASDDLRKHTMIESNKSPVANIVLDNIVRGGVLTQAGIQAGQVFRLVGDPSIIAGLQSGAYTQVSTGQWLLTNARSVADGTFAGGLGMVKASAVSIMAPTIAWQILNAVAGTIQLQRINERLDRLQSSIDRLLDRDENRDLTDVRECQASPERHECRAEQGHR